MAEARKGKNAEQPTPGAAAADEAPAHAASADPLLSCLVFLTRHFGHARTPEALAAGLPVEDGGMSPSLFTQAAERAGLRAKIVKRALNRIPDQVLPAVIVMKDGGACVLVAREGRKQLRIHDPKLDAEVTVDAKELRAGYSGYAIFTAEHAPTEREHRAETADARGHWFRGPVVANMGIYMQALLAAALINVFALTSPVFIMNVYDRVLPNNAIETGWVLAIAALGIFAFDFVIRVLRGYFIDVAGRKSDVVLTRRIYDRVLDMKLAGKGMSTGAFANTLRDFDQVRDFFTSATLTGMVDLPFSFLFIFVISLISPAIAWMLLGLFCVVAVTGLLLQIPVRSLVRKSMKSAETRHGVLVETLNSLETVKGVGGEGRLRGRYGRYVGESALWGQKSRFWSGLSVHFAALVQQCAGILIVVMGMYLVRDGDLTTGGLIACVILGARALAPVGQVASLLTRYHQSVSALRSLGAIMSLPLERPYDTKFLHRPHIEGAFRFEGVSFAYPGRPDKALDNVSLNIPAGYKVGVIGRVGSGKSTLIRMMMKFYEPDQGTILVDETDLRQVDPADLRRNIAWVGQDGVLFNATVRDNIALGKPDATDAEILEAAKMAGVHEFVRRHPHGYDMMIGEGGAGLSGGQRQAVVLARALIKNAPVMICDEPTASMDNFAERMLMDNLRDHVADRTLILVTHKDTLLQLVDYLVLMDNGRVIAQGPRDQVMDALARGKISVAAPYGAKGEGGGDEK